MKIAVVGAGYAGLAIAMLLARNHDVVAIDVVPDKNNMLNNTPSANFTVPIEYRNRIKITTYLDDIIGKQYVIFSSQTKGEMSNAGGMLYS